MTVSVRPAEAADAPGIASVHARSFRDPPALRDLGFDTAILWTADDNTSAQALYRAAGWAADGATRISDHTGVDVPSRRFRHG